MAVNLHPARLDMDIIADEAFYLECKLEAGETLDEIDGECLIEHLGGDVAPTGYTLTRLPSGRWQIDALP